MSRIRTIKPEFWANEKLGEMPAEYQLLFIGLWNLSDRRGFIEDRPKRIKAQLFPYREIDIETAICSLEGEFIRRIVIDNVPYIQVINFSKHQHCNIKEPESKIPSQYWHDADTIQAPSQHGADTQGREGKGKEGEGDARTREDSHTSDKKILSMNDSKIALLADVQWVERICNDFSIPKDQIFLSINSFLNDTDADGKYPRALFDTKSHFRNSLKKGKYLKPDAEALAPHVYNGIF